MDLPWVFLRRPSRFKYYADIAIMLNNESEYELSLLHPAKPKRATVHYISHDYTSFPLANSLVQAHSL